MPYKQAQQTCNLLNRILNHIVSEKSQYIFFPQIVELYWPHSRRGVYDRFFWPSFENKSAEKQWLCVLLLVSLKQCFSLQASRVSGEPGDLRHLSDPTVSRGRRRVLPPSSLIRVSTHGALPALGTRQSHTVHDLSGPRTEPCWRWAGTLKHKHLYLTYIWMHE